MISRKLIFGLLSVALACNAQGGEDLVSREKTFATLERSQHDSGASSILIAYEIRRAYEKSFGGFDPTTQAELSAVLYALKGVALYSGDRDYAILGLRYFERYQSKYAVMPSIVGTVYDMFMDARLFREANRLLDRYPVVGLERFNIDEETASATFGPFDVLEFREKSQSFQKQNIAMPMGTFIVVISNPQCGFSRRAIEAIESDPSSAMMLPRMRWLLPPGSHISPKAMQSWNIAHPQAKLGVIVSSTNWPSLSEWATPTFYVYRDRSLVSIKMGWRGSEDLKTFRYLANPTEFSLKAATD